MSFRRSAVALCAAVATGLSIAPAQAAIVAEPIEYSAPGAGLSLTPIGAYDSGVFDESAAEIVAYHAGSQRVLTINARSGNIDLLDISDPTRPEKVGEVSAGAGNGINSVAIRADGLAVANVEPEDKTAEGSMLFFDATTGEELGTVMLGNNGEHDAALPDMVGISADGRYAFSANEGEPAEDYSFDPEGSVSIVALPKSIQAPAQSDVRVADFRAFNAPGALPEGVRIFGQVGNSTTVAQNLEPEYITEIDGRLYTTLQENNAVAVVDLESATVEKLLPLGHQDHSVTPLDASDKDGGINIRNWPVKGIHQPDAIGAYTAANGRNHLVMANEGDARDWEAYSEEARLKKVQLCEGYQGLTAGEIEHLQSDEGAGRLNVTTAEGLSEDGSCHTQLYSYGSRSFSVIDTEGRLVFNSGDDFEQILAKAVPEYFNSNHSESNFEGRSDDKGPEPEGLALGEIDGRTYAFVGLERIGGIMVYDITDPAHSKFVTYVNNRDFAISMEDSTDIDADLPQAGDLGPEGLAFIPAADSPNRKNLLVVGNEVSGTTTIFQIDGHELRPEGSSFSSSLG
ncbi:choice-of-anchor I family protein [Corynebacterium sp. YIM 101645]|uniref:Choice-of-anchor I family protein n=1 Tax=Corynebacterium lemuris TaxID=1859292 RepID=A0ABT2FXW6_9CORY|nr:choice-of-anchor I family protein [Corynebacterium lemuris]